MEYSIDVIAGACAFATIMGGLLGWSFSRGRNDGSVMVELRSIREQLTLITDELARRITVLENRVQYDGYYTNPRISRQPGE